MYDLRPFLEETSLYLLERLFHLCVRVGWIVDSSGRDAQFPHVRWYGASFQGNIELDLPLIIRLNLGINIKI